MSQCFICNTEHDPDDACRRATRSRAHTTARAAGRDDDLFDEPDDGPKFGPVFTATYDSDDECCGDGIESGQQIRADGAGGYIHASAECEGMHRG